MVIINIFLMFNITKFDFPPHISLLSIFGSNNFLPSIFGVSSKNLLPLKCYDIKKKEEDQTLETHSLLLYLASVMLSGTFFMAHTGQTYNRRRPWPPKLNLPGTFCIPLFLLLVKVRVLIWVFGLGFQFFLTIRLCYRVSIL